LNLQTILAALPRLVPLIGQAQEVAKLVEEVIGSFRDPQDQETLREAIADLEVENDEGHARYQEKLKAAAQR
jgi:hypothetical protein